MSEELTNSVSKLVELTKQIKDARADMKVLIQAEKALKLEVKKQMVDSGLEVINLKKGKISVKKSKKTASLNKASVKSGLTQYFGNEEAAETALKAILDTLETNETTTISLTGLNKE